MTILLIWALEFSKCGWHGRWRKNSFLLMVHGGAASGLLSLGLQPYDPAWALAVPVLAVLPVVLSYHFLWPDPPTGTEWWGRKLPLVSQDRWHVLSFLSSWPVEMVALWTLACSPSATLLQSLFWFGAFGLAAASVPLLLWTGLSGKIHPALAMRPWKESSLWVKLWRKI